MNYRTYELKHREGGLIFDRETIPFASGAGEEDTGQG
jgi:hypothetical protein